MKSYFNLSVMIITLNLFPTYLYCQITTDESPISLINFGLKPQIKTISLTSPDIVKINKEDSINDKIPGKFLRVAVPIPVKIDLISEGERVKLSGGGDYLIRLTLTVKNAQSIDLTFDKFWLPEQGKFFIYNPTSGQAIGAITSQFLRGTSKNPANFSTGIIYGDSITLEYYQTSSVKEVPIINISNVYYGYRYIRKYNKVTKDFGDSGDCQVNINCTEGQNWQQDKKAVARIYLKFPYGAGWCTGSLVNNTCNNLEPLLLTANHCLDNYYDAVSNSILSEWIFYWDYEFAGCDDLANEPEIKSTVGATVVSNNSVSDFAILELTQDPRNLTNFSPYYLGWDYSGNSGTGGVGIHHPMADVKKIATYNITPGNSDCFYSGGTNFWKINWQSTIHGWSVTEDGSSGSPLLNSDHKLIGQLHGAGPLCANPNCSNPSADIGNYGKFSISWTGDGASDHRRRLNYWLDPLGTNPSNINGLASPSISGSNLVCSSGSEFTINNLPTGCSIEWTTGPYIFRTSSQGSNPCTFSSIGNGSSWVGAILHPSCGVDIDLSHLIIWSGNLPTPTISGPAVIKCGYDVPFRVDEISRTYSQSFYWESNILALYPDDEWITYASGYVNGRGTISCTVNSCGTPATGYRNVSVTQCGYKSLLLYPNPAFTEVQVTIIDNQNLRLSSDTTRLSSSLIKTNKQNDITTYNISVYSQYGIKLYSIIKSGNTFTIPLNHLKNGTYIIEANDGIQSFSQQFVIKH